MKLLTQKHLTELLQQWKNYERELEECQRYITDVVTPFLQAADDNITGRDTSIQHKMAQVATALLYMFRVVQKSRPPSFCHNFANFSVPFAGTLSSKYAMK